MNIKSLAHRLAFLVTIIASSQPLPGAQPPFVQEAILPGFSFGTPEFGGYARLVAMSGDTLVVGAPGEASNATGVNGDEANSAAANSGAAYVYVRQGTNWIRQAYLKAGNTGAGDAFGFSVAISGDLIVVGAPWEDSISTAINGNGADNGALSAGAAYVFARTGTNWVLEAYLKAPNTDPGDQFGSSVSIDGNRIVVGANGEKSNATGVNGNMLNNSAAFSGAAYVFVRPAPGQWQFEAYLKRIQSGGSFGVSCSMAGDTIVVGAPTVACVFVRDEAGWHPQAELRAHNPNTPSGDRRFGYSVAASGDTVVVGDWFESSTATGVNGTGSGTSVLGRSGSAYVFVRNGTNWSQQAYLKASNTSELSFFGCSVALDGDLLMVGAYYESYTSTGINGDQYPSDGYNAGAAYSFRRTGTNWAQTAYIKASPAPAQTYYFGRSVCLAGGMAAVASEGLNGIGSTVYLFDGLLPEIDVQQPAGLSLSSGTRRDLASINGSQPTATFTIRNLGEDVLKDFAVSKSGPDAALFTVTTTISDTTEIAPGGSATLTVQFAPDNAAPKYATLTITNNDVDENPFVISLRGLTLSNTQDSDGDGLSDADEFQLAGAGFDWEKSQPGQVSSLLGYVNQSGLYSLTQLQALSVGAPLISRDPETGTMKLTIGLQKATQLTNFIALPLTAPQATVNQAGQLELQILPENNVNFFRLESR